MLLAGGLVIGALVGESGLAPLLPVFVTPFKGVLALFMLELGLVVGERLRDVRQFGVRLLTLGVALPPVLALAGAVVGVLLELSPGHAGGQCQLHRGTDGHAHRCRNRTRRYPSPLRWQSASRSTCLWGFRCTPALGPGGADWKGGRLAPVAQPRVATNA